MILAAVWGFAEATLFFIVPDVFLSAWALRDLRGALRGCVGALVGALAGGALMFVWGAKDPGSALDRLDRLPAVSVGMLERVDQEVLASGSRALLAGPLSGTPYKLYAVQSGRRGVTLREFLLWSIPGRMLRFLLSALLAAGIGRSLPETWRFRHRLALHAGLWTAFYAVYFARMPG